MGKIWPINKTLKILSVTIAGKGGDSKSAVEIRTTVVAPDKETAFGLGRRKIGDAINFLHIASEGEIKISPLTDARVREIGSKIKTGFATATSRAYIEAPPEPLNEKMFSTLSKAGQEINSLGKEEIGSLITGLRWWEKGVREENAIDRFLAYWIALEVLVEGQGDALVKKVTNQLISITPKVVRMTLKKKIGQIYGVRGKIVHYGVMEPEKLAENTELLKKVLESLIRHKMGLTSYTVQKIFR